MLDASFEEFARQARQHRTIPVVRVLASDLLTPVGAFLRIAGSGGAAAQDAFLLESVEGGEHVGRYTFLGVGPYQRIEARGRAVSISRGTTVEHGHGDITAIVDRELRRWRIDPALLRDLPPFCAGVVGYLSYDIVRQWEPVPSVASDETNVPDACLLFFDRVIAFDHAKQQVFLVATVRLQGEESDEQLQRAYAAASDSLDELEEKLHSPLAQEPASATDAIQARQRTTREQFMRSVERVKEYIRAGDAFQVVLSLRLELELPSQLAPFAIYRALRRVNPSPYMYYLRMSGVEVLGSSPEMLVKVHGREVEYRPIAGTRARGGDVAADLALEEQLLADEKERAEHVMLVDLGRNDLGRVSEYGSVEVARFMFIERYSHVMHLVSSLRSRLRVELSAMDALRACFPAGTLSGAPKVRAMQIIEELEPVRRGIYGGAVLYSDFAGSLDSCIAIRTMVVRGREAYIQAGAGIVADSDAASEFQECMNKAAALLRAVEMARG